MEDINSDSIPFQITGKITYDDTKGITRNITSISVTIDGKENSYTSDEIQKAKLEIAKKIAKLKKKEGGQKGGYHGYAKNSTEYKKQKEKLNSNTLRFKKNPHTKTYKK
jgi:hypothetical protein